MVDQGARGRPVVIGARGSALSLRQAALVVCRLAERLPEVEFRIQPVKAAADHQPELPLAALGGEGVFVKELEAKLAGGEIDLAVHSMKDLPLDIPAGLTIAAIVERDDPRDALISRSGADFDALPAGSRIGTSSLRRRSQLSWRRRDLELLEIRGNVDTRLRKLDEGRYDAIVLAACGLARLGLQARICEHLPVERMVPEPGQGALAIETRRDGPFAELAASLDDAPTRACVEAERACLAELGGGCRVPIAAYATREGGRLRLLGAVLSPDGSRRLAEEASGPLGEPVALGRGLGRRLLGLGARELLAAS